MCRLSKKEHLSRIFHIIFLETSLKSSYVATMFSLVATCISPPYTFFCFRGCWCYFSTNQLCVIPMSQRNPDVMQITMALSRLLSRRWCKFRAWHEFDILPNKTSVNTLQINYCFVVNCTAYLFFVLSEEVQSLSDSWGNCTFHWMSHHKP